MRFDRPLTLGHSHSISAQVLGGIRMLKFMAWERSFEQRLQAVREKELRYQRTNFIISVRYLKGEVKHALNSSDCLQRYLGSHAVDCDSGCVLALGCLSRGSLDPFRRVHFCALPWYPPQSMLNSFLDIGFVFYFLRSQPSLKYISLQRTQVCGRPSS